MSEAQPPAPQGRVSRPAWPGLVWAIPLSALIVVLFLGIRAFVNRGVQAVVTFQTASGVKIGDTKVVYQGYEVGRVVKIDVDGRDMHRVNLTLRLDHRARPIMRTGTVFWMVGASPSLTDLSSVKAALSGPTIGVAPSFEGQPTDHFVGLGDEPAVPPGAAGTAYVLYGDRLGSLKRRSSITYRGQEVGKVTSTSLSSPGRFKVDVFIFKPFDRLVRPGAMFWPASAVQLSLGGGGVSAQLDNPASLLLGGLQMEVADDAAGAPSPAGAQFDLYPSRAAAQSGPRGPRVTYAMTFASGGDLAEGAPVTLLGYPVGEVTQRDLDIDPRTGNPVIRVKVALEAARLRARGDLKDPASLRAGSDAAVAGLLARGFRAKLSQTPPLIGARGVVLERVRDARPAALGAGVPPLIPSVSGSGDIGDQVSSILAKVDRVPIERIGRNVEDTTRRIRTLVSSPKVDDSLDHLHNALAQVDRMTATAEPQVGPLLTKLNRAADEAAAAAAAARGLLAGEGPNPDASLPHAIQELSDAAVSIRALADGLSRHPESLLKGKEKSK